MQEYTVMVYNDRTEWYQDGKLHRIDGPAVEYTYGYTDGYTAWYQNGKRHREDGPAIECNTGDRYWYQNGKFHRIDGPAIEHSDGNKEWWIGGTEYTEEEFNEKTQSKQLTVAEIEKLLGYKIKIIA